MRRGEVPPKAFQAPVDVHASADGQVYMFRRQRVDLADSSEEEDLNVLELRVYPEQDRLERLHLLEREVSDGDSLNKLALQYGCKVAEIKRVNNLIQEQDLFALKSVKIPVQKHSFLTEADTDLSVPGREISDSPTPRHLDGNGSYGKPRLQEVTDFLKEVDHDIEKLIQSTNGHDDVFLDGPAERSGFRGRRGASSGADWGMQWWNVVVAMLLIGIILPIFYIVYFKTKDAGGVSPADGSDTANTSADSSGGVVAAGRTGVPQQLEGRGGHST